MANIPVELQLHTVREQRHFEYLLRRLLNL